MISNSRRLIHVVTPERNDVLSLTLVTLVLSWMKILSINKPYKASHSSR